MPEDEEVEQGMIDGGMSSAAFAKASASWKKVASTVNASRSFKVEASKNGMSIASNMFDAGGKVNTAHENAHTSS